MLKKIQSVRGMNDLLPEQVAQWQWVEEAIRDVTASYGYREIRTPIVERSELFYRSIGEATDIVEKEMYTFADRNGDSLTLRPEATASCVRAAIHSGLVHNRSERLWYLGPMFRHERPQKGRYRQFHQFGIEAQGWLGPDADAEVILLGDRLWKQLELEDVQLEINTLGSGRSRADYREALQGFLIEHEKDLDENSQRRLETNPLRVLDSKDPQTQAILQNAPDLMSYLAPKEIDNFQRLLELLDAGGVSPKINNRLVRGLDYYTGPVFEWVTDRLGAQNAICAGGRYDGLFAELGGRDVPAAGFACGMERLLELVVQGSLAGKVEAADVWLVLLGADAESAGFTLAESLRDRGLRAICNCGGGSISQQLRRADRSEARFAAVIGEEELRDSQVTIKPLRDGGSQVRMAREGVAEYLLSNREA